MNDVVGTSLTYQTKGHYITLPMRYNTQYFDLWFTQKLYYKTTIFVLKTLMFNGLLRHHFRFFKMTYISHCTEKYVSKSIQQSNWSYIVQFLQTFVVSKSLKMKIQLVTLNRKCFQLEKLVNYIIKHIYQKLKMFAFPGISLHLLYLTWFAFSNAVKKNT